MPSSGRETLLRWGGISSLIFVLLFTALLAITFAVGGPEWSGWTPLFSIAVCFYVVVLLGGDELLTSTHYALARIGSAFGLLLLVVLFAEIAAWGADRVMLRSGFEPTGGQPSPMIALFTSTHVLAIWFHGIWITCWGLVLLKLEGRARLTGWLMVAFGASYAIYYLLLRLGSSQAEIAHTTGHVALITSHSLLGLILLDSSRDRAA